MTGLPPSSGFGRFDLAETSFLILSTAGGVNLLHNLRGSEKFCLHWSYARACCTFDSIIFVSLRRRMFAVLTWFGEKFNIDSCISMWGPTTFTEAICSVHFFTGVVELLLCSGMHFNLISGNGALGSTTLPATQALATGSIIISFLNLVGRV